MSLPYLKSTISTILTEGAEIQNCLNSFIEISSSVSSTEILGKLDSQTEKSMVQILLLGTGNSLQTVVKFLM